MKAVFVLGFYHPVRTALDSVHPERIREESLIWIGQRSQQRDAEVNLSEFSAVYRKRKKAGMTSALVLVAKLRGRDYVIDAVRSIITVANENSEVKCEVVELENAGDRDAVLGRIADFGLLPPSGPSCELVRKKVPKGKILCVSLDKNTSVLEALKRVGFTDDVISACFEEERITGARNSGLMQLLIEHANHILHSFICSQDCGRLRRRQKENSEYVLRLRPRRNLLTSRGGGWRASSWR